MIYKAISTLFLSLAATAGVSSLIATACGGSGSSEDSQPTQAAVVSTPAPAAKAAPVEAVNAFPKLTFEQPVEFTHANDGTNRVFVVEQEGRIRQFDNNAGVASADTYLDIKNRVTSGGEMGLLGLAFHPQFAKNGYFYVNYTKNNPRETVISRFKAASAKAPSVDPATETVLLKFKQPYSNHNGGKVLFGPDGYLYIATGDGGSGGDPQNNGQNRQSYLGKILRIDVNAADKGNYGIPKDNPFVDDAQNALPEIYAYGLRNPWRISFDGQGRLWAGDVGQNKLEEIDIIRKGGNYGWRIKEGQSTYNREGNSTTAVIGPIWQYSHDNGDVSVTGGQVYRGKAHDALIGKYIYADYASGRVWALTADGSPTGGKATNQLLLNRAGTISAFGEDARNELYLCDHAEGRILKFAPSK
ncbi:glucose sorbosone dehydrogenase [Rudanella paleaurantiibacter]|uniref:Glucose sorbosone dehydrogenase n=1 Tax=Rudanella paleaurantiibacter TaxID=2614655 RepID=A0A7J5TZ63_9BACT|nr:PQQ-dependent sugar dehydrogenase [Rudanella paleaurantiibacter]KAB7730403.1 glucose sorbosone dehydrogenase [Rudanella paleaurantiibacter]